MANEPWLRSEYVPLVVRNATDQSVPDDAWILARFPHHLARINASFVPPVGQQANRIQFDLKRHGEHRRGLWASSQLWPTPLSTKKMGSALEKESSLQTGSSSGLEGSDSIFYIEAFNSTCAACQTDVDFCHWQSKRIPALLDGVCFQTAKWATRGAR